jgi:hypothetical protein
VTVDTVQMVGTKSKQETSERLHWFVSTSIGCLAGSQSSVVQIATYSSVEIYFVVLQYIRTNQLGDELDLPDLIALVLSFIRLDGTSGLQFTTV